MILHNDAVDAILTRRSIRSYQAKQISEDALETILTAGQYAPSGMNQQSAKAIVVQSKERMQQLVQLAKAAEQVDHNPFYDAPTVILVFADATQLAPLEDGCNVLENMMLAAHAIGLGAAGSMQQRCCFQPKKVLRFRKNWGFLKPIRLWVRLRLVIPTVQLRSQSHARNHFSELCKNRA